MPKIHPTALVDAGSHLAEDVEIGPFCIVEADVTIGAGTVLRSHAVVRKHTTLGAGNFVDTGTVLGGEPQDLKFDPASVTYLRIGDKNTFREGVTISRATTPGGSTVIGSRNFWMAGAHAGHDSHVGDDVILVNGAAVGGHAVIGARAFISAHVVVHQFCWLGEMVMTEGHTAIRSHVPPYVMVIGINRVGGLNVVGLRRAAHLSDEDRFQIKEAYRITYRSGLTPPKALAEMDTCTHWGAAATAFREFIRKIQAAQKPFNRGLCPTRPRMGQH